MSLPPVPPEPSKPPSLYVVHFGFCLSPALSPASAPVSSESRDVVVSAGDGEHSFFRFGRISFAVPSILLVCVQSNEFPIHGAREHR